MIIERAMTPDWLSNTYLVAKEPGGDALLIDAGGPMDELFAKADEHDLTVTHILLTHHHGDHVAELDKAKERWPDAEVLIHAGEREHVAGATGDLEPDTELELAGLTVRTLHTPGHTNGMISLLIEGNVFTGDTLFKNSVGGVRAPGSTSYADLKHSVMDVLLQLPPETTIRPGHTDRPVLFHVDRDRDGGSFSARHVRAVQHGEVIFSMVASFHQPREAPTLDVVATRGGPPAEDLPPRPTSSRP